MANQSVATFAAERLQTRESYFTSDESIALMIKSGDIEGLRWLFQKGWPMNYRVQDHDGMCYLGSDLAAHHGQMEIARLFSDLEKMGPPRQKLRLGWQQQEKEFIMANSKEDWKMFKQEVKMVFSLPKPFKIIGRGDKDEKKMKWRELREGRRYVIMFK